MNTYTRAISAFVGAVLSCLLILSSPVRAEDASASAPLDQAELDQMLAPIALYPDTVLSQVLIASTYPLEIVEADRWVQKHPNLKGEDALNAVEDQDWDPSVKALVPFPDLLAQMSEDLDWTQSLGEAYLQDQARIMDTVQKLRQRAYDNGSLQKMDHIKTEREDHYIVIESASPDVIYVPYYDTRVVYGSWWWADYPPIFWGWSGYHAGVTFFWGPRVRIFPGFFYSSFQWHSHHVVVVDRDHRHHRYYSGRQISRSQHARRWEYNPSHRRGVVYRRSEVRQRYGDPRHYDVRDHHARPGRPRSVSEPARVRSVQPMRSETHSSPRVPLHKRYTAPRTPSTDTKQSTYIGRQQPQSHNSGATSSRGSSNTSLETQRSRGNPVYRNSSRGGVVSPRSRQRSSQPTREYRGRQSSDDSSSSTNKSDSGSHDTRAWRGSSRSDDGGRSSPRVRK